MSIDLLYLWESTEKLLGFLPDDLERWRLVDLLPISDWVHPSNKLILIGDAVHATLPYLAQGAAMAVEDATTIGVALSHLESLPDLPKTLEFIRNVRLERTHTIQRGSFANRFFIHMAEGPMQDMRNQFFGVGDFPGTPNLMANTLFQEWMYGHDAEQHAEAEWRKRFSSRL